MKKIYFIGFVFLSVNFNVFATTTSSDFENSCKTIDPEYKFIEKVRINSLSFFSKWKSIKRNGRAINIQTVKTGDDTSLVLRYAFFDPSPTDNAFVQYIIDARLNNVLLDICYDASKNIFAISDHERQ